MFTESSNGSTPDPSEERENCVQPPRQTVTPEQQMTVFYVRYVTQYLMALGVAVFCAWQLTKPNSSSYHTLYISILTMIMGVYIPTPKLKKKM